MILALPKKKAIYKKVNFFIKHKSFVDLFLVYEIHKLLSFAKQKLYLSANFSYKIKLKKPLNKYLFNRFCVSIKHHGQHLIPLQSNKLSMNYDQYHRTSVTIYTLIT